MNREDKERLVQIKKRIGELNKQKSAKLSAAELSKIQDAIGALQAKAAYIIKSDNPDWIKTAIELEEFKRGLEYKHHQYKHKNFKKL